MESVGLREREGEGGRKGESGERERNDGPTGEAKNELANTNF
jgi:hypothetical protein